MNNFSAAVTDYLSTRRAMGYKLVQDGRLLHGFAAHLDAVGVEHLTTAEAVAWATGHGTANTAWRAGRLTIIRSFARYQIAFDPATEIPPVGLLPQAKHRIVPHIYTDAEIARVINEAGRLAHPHRADTYQTLIGLIAVTGMRVGETVRLDHADGDLHDGIVMIRNTKFRKSRDVPVYASTSDAFGPTPTAATSAGMPRSRAPSSPPAPGHDSCATTSAPSTRRSSEPQASRRRPDGDRPGRTISGTPSRSAACRSFREDVLPGEVGRRPAEDLILHLRHTQLAAAARPAPPGRPSSGRRGGRLRCRPWPSSPGGSCH